MAEAAGREEVAATTLKDKSEDSEAAAESSKVVPSQQQQQQKEGGEEEEEEELECAVCLQKCVHPVRLPCSHIFCFLCVKGVANQSKRCAMCRQEIPADFLDHPTLLAAVEGEKEEVLPGGYQWFYEGRNGWWQYDERTSQELEAAYGSGQRACEVLVAGFLYIIDFDRMVQLRRNDPSRRRRIKRDLSSIPKKGVAGIKLPSQLEAELSALHTAAHAIHIPRDQGDSGDIVSPLAGNNNNDLCPRTPTAPSNTPQTPHTPSAASSSSTSPDTTDPTHPHHALAPDPYHHHHYHHHLPHHYHHHHHHHHPPHHHHHHHHQPQQHSSSSSSSASSPHNLNQHHQLHIPHVLANNLSVENSQPYPESQSSPNLAPTHPTASEPSVNSDQPQTDLESAVHQMDQLSISADAPEFYPLDLTEDSTEETEQYHLTLSSEEEQL